MSDLHKSDPYSPYADYLEFVRDYARRNDGYPLVQPVVDFINANPDPQIIRTVEELEALDPDTIVQPELDEWIEWPVVSYARHLAVRVTKWGHYSDLPVVVICEGARVRAARKALEEA